MSETAPTPKPFKDRSRGLAGFGVLMIILGLIAMMPLFSGGMSLHSPLSYGFVRSYESGVWMIWLGVGSFLARRWAWALLLCIGIIHFILGILSLPGSLIVMFTLPKSASGSILLGAVLNLLFKLGVPAALLAFYSEPSVRRTCEARDPAVRWTDRCPVPVLVCCVLLTERVLEWLTAFVFGQPMPLVGRLIAGPVGRELWLAMALVTLYSIWRIYRFDRLVWSAYSAIFVFFSVSSLLTVIGVFQGQGAAPNVGAQMWGETANALLGLGCLCFARFYFPAQSAD